MPNAQTVETLMKDLESERVERTVSTDKTDKFAQAVCAFANDMSASGQPGYLLVGVTDEGTASGLRVSDQLLQNLAALRSDGNIQPLPAITVERVVLDAGEVAVVTVQPADLPPVRYKGQVWIRVGPRRAIASEQEERILSERRTNKHSSFDALPCREASMADLSIPLFTAYRQKAVAAEVIAANHRHIAEQLASLRFYDLKADCPTFGGILAFCDRPTYFLPGAYVQWCRFRGTEMVEKPIDQGEIRGDLFSIVREVEIYAKASIRNVLRNVTAMQEELVPSYPFAALRELLFNAIIHRDYQDTAPIRFFWFDDHVRIYNPGGLYGLVTPQTLTTRSGYRNPIVAETLKTFGFINRFGYGIQMVQRLLARNEQRPPDIVCDDRYFDVSIYARDLDNLPNYPDFSPNSPNLSPK